jgi:WD40 repeat protein
MQRLTTAATALTALTACTRNRTGALVHEDSSHQAPIRGAAFSPDGAHLLTCGDDKTARVWATSDWHCVQQL